MIFLDLDQDWRSVCPVLDPKFYQGYQQVTKVATSNERVKHLFKMYVLILLSMFCSNRNAHFNATLVQNKMFVSSLFKFFCRRFELVERYCFSHQRVKVRLTKNFQMQMGFSCSNREGGQGVRTPPMKNHKNRDS